MTKPGETNVIDAASRFQVRAERQFEQRAIAHALKVRAGVFGAMGGHPTRADEVRATLFLGPIDPHSAETKAARQAVRFIESLGGRRSK